MFINRFLPLLVPFFSFLFFEFYFFWPKMIFVLVLFFCLFIFFSIRQFILEHHQQEKVINFFLFPSLSFVLTLLFTALLTSSILIHIIFIFESVLIYIYFKSIYYRLVAPKKYSKKHLENFLSYSNFILFYFLASIIYGYQVYLSINFLVLLIIFLFVSFLIVYQIFWINELNNSNNIFFILIIILCLSEISWAVSFMSLSYYILGLLVSVCYYIIIGLTRFYLLATINKQIIKSYLIFGFLSIIVVLLTSRWI